MKYLFYFMLLALVACSSSTNPNPNPNPNEFSVYISSPSGTVYTVELLKDDAVFVSNLVGRSVTRALTMNHP